jgi:tRNA threonylcarbamoyladenosine biosynthesis protein TsaB
VTTFALDTSTPGPSLALARGDVLVAELTLAPVPEAGRRVMQAAHGLLQATGTEVSDLDGVVVGIGPGGFTGLRIGIATALALGQALGRPVTGVVSLEALALGIADVAGDGARLVPVTDARRREVFAAVYRMRGDGSLAEEVPPAALTPAALVEVLGEDEPAVLAGDGAHLVPADGVAGLTVLRAGSPAHAVRAGALVRRALAGGARPARPVYARLPDAEVTRRRALGEAR